MIHRGIVLFLFFLVLNVSGKPSPPRKMMTLSPGNSVTTQSIVDVDMSTGSTFVIETQSTESTACLDCPLKGAPKLNRNPELKESDQKNPIEKTIAVGDAICAFCEEYDKPEEKLTCKKTMCSSV